MRKLILIPLVCLVAACSSTATHDSTVITTLKESDTLETLFVFGTLKAIAKADEPAAKAARIRGYAERFLGLAGEENVRVAALKELLGEIVADLDNPDPADLYLISRSDPLIARFAGEDEFIVGERKEALVAFLEDLIGATELYAQ